jgi:DNA-binding beta-propeller fold protein YncE
MRTVSLPNLVLAATIAVVSVAANLRAQQYKTEKHNIGGEGAFDYLSVDAPTGRVFVSRSTHVMVIDGATGNVIGDLKDTPRVHGIAFAPQAGLGFTTNAGDSTSTMFDLKTLEVKRKIKAGKDGLDGIMYDEATDKILTINHSKPSGTAVVIDVKSGDVVATIPLSGNAPEGGVSNGKGRIYINIEDKNAIDVVDTKTWKVVETWSIDPCDGPTGIAMDRAANRIFSGCSKTSVVVDASTGKVVAQIPNGDGVDALGWDQSQKLMYIPAGGSGNVTVVHEDSPDKYTVVETVPTMRGARTIAVDTNRHVAYVFTPEYGPSTPPSTPGGRATRGPITAAWLITIKR